MESKSVESLGRRLFLRRVGLGVLASVPVLLAAESADASSSARSRDIKSCSKVTIEVNEERTAPANPPFNGCTIAGTVAGAGVGGADIQWMVTLFYGTEWHIQFQAFTEDSVTECQYPIKVKGSYSGAGLPTESFTTSSGFSLGLSPDEHPQLTLAVDSVTIDSCHPACG